MAEEKPADDKPKRFIPPRTDLVFKRLFGSDKSKELLIDFLNSFLSEKVRDLDYLNVELPKESIDEKLSRLDILARLQTGQLVNIEVQLRNLRVFPERTLYYGAKVYAGQLKEGSVYTMIKPVICVNIVDFVIEANNDVPDCHTVYNFRRSDGKLMTRALEFRFIELPKSEAASGRLKLWLDFIKAKNEEEIQMAGKQDELIEKATEMYHGLVNGPESGALYQRYKDLLDRNTMMQEALEEGIQQGLEQGQTQAKAKLVANMRSKGLSLDEIASLSGLTLEEIKQLLQRNE